VCEYSSNIRAPTGIVNVRQYSRLERRHVRDEDVESVKRSWTRYPLRRRREEMLSHCSFVVGSLVGLKACEFSTKMPPRHHVDVGGYACGRATPRSIWRHIAGADLRADAEIGGPQPTHATAGTTVPAQPLRSPQSRRRRRHADSCGSHAIPAFAPRGT
jgi:hypothetical protein